MPVLLRKAEAEVSMQDLITELDAFKTMLAKQNTAVKLGDGTTVEAGDVVLPRPELYAQVSEGCPILIMGTVPIAGVFCGAFHMKTGDIGFAFFNPAHIEKRYEPELDMPEGTSA